jgi:hypothetical protein
VLPAGNYTLVLNATSNDEVGGSLEIVSYFSVLDAEEPPGEDDPFIMVVLAVIGFVAIFLIVIFVLYLIIKGRGDEEEE